jgi:hypothetical protein
LEQINGLENRKETQIEKSAKSHKGGRRRASDLWHGWPHAEKKRKEMCGVFCINLELSKSYKRSVN